MGKAHSFLLGFVVLQAGAVLCRVCGPLRIEAAGSFGQLFSKSAVVTRRSQCVVENQGGASWEEDKVLVAFPGM